MTKEEEKEQEMMSFCVDIDDFHLQVYRDKSGQKVGLNAKKDSDMTKEEKEEQEMKNMVWGKGLVQMEEKIALVCFCQAHVCEDACATHAFVLKHPLEVYDLRGQG